MRKVLYIIVLLFSCSAISQADGLFEKGKEQYKNGNFQAAISSWKKVLDGGEHSANLYFNLGNANYKLNNIGASIFYYEKARQLNPLDNDIKTNLSFAENARIDFIEPLPQTVFKKWYNNIAGIFTYNGWATAAVVCSFLFVTLFLLYYFSASAARKRLLFTTSIVSVILLFGSLAMAFTTLADFNNDKPAIIFADEVQVKSDPTLAGNPAFTLHEGTKVQIVSQDGNWYRIELADGKDGWIPSSDLKQL